MACILLCKRAPPLIGAFFYVYPIQSQSLEAAMSRAAFDPEIAQEFYRRSQSVPPHLPIVPGRSTFGTKPRFQRVPRCVRLVP